MKHKTVLKIYEWASYILIAGATAFIFLQNKVPNGLVIVGLLLALAMFMRMLMERTRCKSYEEEIDELQADLRRLTQLLAEAKRREKKENQ